MPNMSYVRFENTFVDLQDCYQHMDEPELSTSEEYYRQALIDLCKTISEEYGDSE